MYQDFAEIYDALMNDVDYESWAEHYTRLLSIFGIRGGKICECACGTGGLTLPLRRRGFQIHKPVDAVIATCDGVNYLMTEEDLLSFFRAAKRAIRPGGALIYDVSTPHKLKNILCAGLMCEDRPDITYLWQNTWHERSQTVDLDLCFFIREADGRYRRTEEHQSQRAWDMETLKNVMWKAGFRGVCMYSEATLNPAKEGDQRWHVAAANPEG